MDYTREYLIGEKLVMVWLRKIVDKIFFKIVCKIFFCLEDMGEGRE